VASLTSYSNLHRFAVVTAVATFLLIIAGGLVTSTQSGLSVPDWPTTYGHFMFAYPLDQMVGGIFYEHSHRMIASTVGFLTVILALWLWKREDRRWMKTLGFVALAAVIAQGILGGLTVKYLLPMPISVGHATLAQTFFVIVAAIALFTSKWWRSRVPALADAGSPRIMTLAAVAVGAVYVQLILGAVMRHSDAGLAVPDVPLAYGQLFPSLSPDAIAAYNAALLNAGIRIAADDPVTSSQILIHMAHRIWAMITAAVVIWFSVRLIRHPNAPGRFIRLGGAQIILIILQIALGAFTVLSRKAVDVTTIHVATGALILVCTSLSLLHAAKMFGAELARGTDIRPADLNGGLVGQSVNPRGTDIPVGQARGAIS
jgi:cytochrome c oxidase assembly protein subunit 15